MTAKNLKGYTGTANVVIEFKTQSEGLKLAKRFKRLAENPAMQLNVTFKDISNEQN